MFKQWIARTIVLTLLFATIFATMGSSAFASDEGSGELAPAQDGRNCAIDLVLVLDSSGSIALGDYNLMKNWAKDLIARFDLGSDGARVGVVQFSSSAESVIALSDDATAINGSINRMRHIGGGTNATSGIRAGQQLLDGRGRADAPKIMIVLTDGYYDDPAGTVGYAQSISTGETAGRGTTILGVAVGSFDLTYVNRVAGGEHNVRQVPDFESLQDILSILHDYSCAVATEGTVNASSLPSSSESSSAPAAVNTPAPAPTSAPASSGSSASTAAATPAPAPTTAPTAAPAASTASGDCMVHSILVGEKVNMREGPGLGEVWVDFLAYGDHRVVGQARDSENVTWWQLASGYWVRHDIVGEVGNCAAVPVTR